MLVMLMDCLRQNEAAILFTVSIFSINLIAFWCNNPFKKTADGKS